MNIVVLYLRLNTKKSMAKALKYWLLNKMPQRLPIALGEVKAGNTLENLLTEIRQNIYSLYRETDVTKKVYSNIMNSIKV